MGAVTTITHITWSQRPLLRSDFSVRLTCFRAVLDVLVACMHAPDHAYILYHARSLPYAT